MVQAEAGRARLSTIGLGGELALGLRQALRWLPATLALAAVLLAPVAPPREARVRALAAPHTFNLVDWMGASLVGRADRLWAGVWSTRSVLPGDYELVRDFLLARGTERVPRRGAAEPAIERLVAQALLESDTGGGRLLPPLLLAFDRPPQVLVTSPRDALRVEHSVLLQGALDGAEIERLERSADSTGVSSLVTPIGGIATYPAIVLDDAPPDRLLASVAHEWLHHYLFFFPLGQRYWSSAEARAINETAADLVGDEVAERLLPRLGLPARPRDGRGESARGFDFRGFMRGTRLEVERLLAVGEIERAESYMRQQGDELARRGYRIRKLNQAYFAFHGNYGETAAASPHSPVPALLRALRAASPTLGEFLERVRQVTSVEELRAAVETKD